MEQVVPARGRLWGGPPFLGGLLGRIVMSVSQRQRFLDATLRLRIHHTLLSGTIPLASEEKAAINVGYHYRTRCTVSRCFIMKSAAALLLIAAAFQFQASSRRCTPFAKLGSQTLDRPDTRLAWSPAETAVERVRPAELPYRRILSTSRCDNGCSGLTASIGLNYRGLHDGKSLKSSAQ